MILGIGLIRTRDVRSTFHKAKAFAVLRSSAARADLERPTKFDKGEGCSAIVDCKEEEGVPKPVVLDFIRPLRHP